MSTLVFESQLDPDIESPLDEQLLRGTPVRVTCGWNEIPHSRSGGSYFLVIDSVGIEDFHWDCLSGIDISFIHEIDILQDVLHEHGIRCPPMLWHKLERQKFAYKNREKEPYLDDIDTFSVWNNQVGQWVTHTQRTMQQEFGEESNVRHLL